MPLSLRTIQAKVDIKVKNQINAKLIHEFDEYLDDRRCSEGYRKNSLKGILYYSAWLSEHNPEKSFFDISRSDEIVPWLKTFRKPIEQDEEEKWKTTYNDYLARLIFFFRWLHNVRIPGKLPDEVPIDDWKTPAFLKIKKMKSKRKSTYAISEVWQRDEVLTILPYEPDSRNKAIIASLWDMDGRNHEACKMKNKHVQYFQKYARAEVPSNTKTGGGPVLLRLAFPYLLMWKNEHPFKNDPEAPLFCNMKGGKTLGDQLVPDSIWRITNNLKNNIKALVNSGKIKDEKEREKLEFLLRTKRWNPYCFRHSAIRHDSAYLPGFALNQKVRWVPGSKQPRRYIAMELSSEVEKTILVHDGIVDQTEEKQGPINNICPRCTVSNALENRVCFKCGYALTSAAFQELQAVENNKLELLQKELAGQKELMRQYIDITKALLKNSPNLLIKNQMGPLIPENQQSA